MVLENHNFLPNGYEFREKFPLMNKMGLFCTKPMCHNFKFRFCFPENKLSIKNMWSTWASGWRFWMNIRMTCNQDLFINPDSQLIFCWFVGHIDGWVLDSDHGWILLFHHVILHPFHPHVVCPPSREFRRLHITLYKH